MRSPTLLLLLPFCIILLLATTGAFAPQDRKACLQQPHYKFVPTRMDPTNPRASFAAMMRKISLNNKNNNDNDDEEQGTIKRIYTKTKKAVKSTGSYIKDKVVSFKNKVVNVFSSDDEKDKNMTTIMKDKVVNAKDKVVDKADAAREKLHNKAEDAKDKWDEKTPDSAKEAGEELGEAVDESLDTVTDNLNATESQRQQ